MVCGTETKDLILEDQKGCIRGCEEFKYLGVKIDKEDRQEDDIKNRINKGRAITALLNGALQNRQVTRKNKLQITQQIKVLSHMELKHGNLTKIKNQNLCRWKWTF